MHPGSYVNWWWPDCVPLPPVYTAKELTAGGETTTQEAVVGGEEPAHVSLEYEADAGATSASVKVTITDLSGTAEWNLTGFPAGPHTRRDFVRVQPGTKMKLEVASAAGHLRWLETMSR
jgi:hypothetical protein